MKKAVLPVATIVLAAAAILGYIYVVVPGRTRHEAERLMKQYAAAPDQQTASRLLELLCKQRVPKEQGDRIFELLLRPEVAVRTAYARDSDIYISACRPFDLGFYWGSNALRVDEGVYAGGTFVDGGSSSGGNHLFPGPRHWHITRMLADDGSVVPPEEPGTYSVRLRLQYALVPSAGHATAAPMYECAFDIPLAIRVVEPGEAERVELTSGPTLDAAMRRSFVIVAEPGAGMSYGVGSETYHMNPWFTLRGSGLRENVGFRASYRDEAGFTKPFEDFFIRQRAGSSLGTTLPSALWAYGIPIENLRLEPGHHKGVVVLETDADLAYRDAAIKTIWDGTLELPIEFDVKRAK